MLPAREIPAMKFIFVALMLLPLPITLVAIVIIAAIDFVTTKLEKRKWKQELLLSKQFS